MFMNANINKGEGGDIMDIKRGRERWEIERDARERDMRGCRDRWENIFFVNNRKDILVF